MGRGPQTATARSLGTTEVATGKQELVSFQAVAGSPNSWVLSHLATGLDSTACKIENTH